jgi:hypothetical protein
MRRWKHAGSNWPSTRGRAEAIGDAETSEIHVAELQTDWRKRLGRLRAGSAADLLIGALAGAPIVTVNGAAQLIQRTYQATNLAIAQLEKAGIVTQVNIGRPNRAFEAPELIKQFTDLERRLGSPTGNTHSLEPLRRVPR